MDHYMQMAVEAARTSLAEGDYPYGSVLVRNGEVIGVGRNHVNTQNDPTSHAEIDVLRAAGLQPTYADTIMYASAFPCPMCAGAAVMMGVPRIVVGATWPGYEVSRALLESQGIQVEILDLEECRDLLK